VHGTVYEATATWPLGHASYPVGLTAAPAGPEESTQLGAVPLPPHGNARALAFALEVKGLPRAGVIGPVLRAGLGQQRGGRSGGGAWSAG
jgi:hypothetical protein